MLLITGSNGQLGTVLSQLLPNALLAGSKRLDITDAHAVSTFVEDHHIRTIINCAAYTAVDHAEDNIALATRINVDGPRNLAQTKARLIHISTDYVFDGLGNTPYTEEDPTRPQSIYGKTKLAGEQAVLDYADTAIVLRTSWLYSPFGNNFVKTMRRLGIERNSLNVVCDQIGTPTSAFDLAQAIADILPQLQTNQKEIYHYSNEGLCSWFDFAHEIMMRSALLCQVNPIEKKDYPTKAPRPAYSVLDKSKIKQAFGLSIPHWAESLQRDIAQFE